MKFDSQNGWLDQRGQFYPCECWEHDSLAEKLFPNSENAVETVEKLGWIRLKDEWPFAEAVQAPNDDQVKSLVDYADEFGVTLPSFCQ